MSPRGATSLLVAALAVSGTSAHADSPRIDYTLSCMGCHLEDGAGTPGKVPALKDEIGKFLHVDGGREYLAQVPGTAQAPLSDARVAAVLNWILRNFSADELPDDFAPYTAEEVEQLRTPLSDAASVRARLLSEIEQLGLD